MDQWTPTQRYSWGGYALGPVANNTLDQGFLWESGRFVPANFDFAAGATGLPAALRTPQPVVPAACLQRGADGRASLPGGCLVPPLAVCRSSLVEP